MRKWMSDRLKRRKKSDDDAAAAGSEKPEPLQPRFYDDEPKPSAAAPAAEGRVEFEPEPPLDSVRSADPEPTPSGSGAESPLEPRPRIARRRRGRGGRSGSRTKRVAAAGGDDPESGPKESGVPDPLLGGEGATQNASEQRRSAQPSAQQARTAASRSGAAGAALAQASPSSRPSKGTVVLAIGLPGSGKSSWFKRHNIHPLSSDLLRELLFDDAQEQRFQDLIFSNLRSMLKARLIARRPMNYVDTTNLTPQDRHSWIKLAKDYGYDVQGVFFDVPLDVCMERHQRRGRAVPDDVMRKMAGKLKPPTFEEGFSKITVVRVKQKEKEKE